MCEFVLSYRFSGEDALLTQCTACKIKFCHLNIRKLSRRKFCMPSLQCGLSSGKECLGGVYTRNAYDAKSSSV